MATSTAHNEYMARLYQVETARQHKLMVDCLWMAETFPEDGEDFVASWLAHAVRHQKNARSNAELARRYLGL